MEFLFFDAADKVLFTRADADRAIWTVEEYRLEADFPYIAEKALQRGQRVGFTDDAGVLQLYELRKVETREPGHYQSIVAEHIALAELSDEHIARTEITSKTAAQALTTALTGTLWSVGNNTASGTQTADIALGSVWNAVGAIQENWNVYITPRVTWNATGITGRYLDISPAQGTWRGMRLAIDKNIDDAGVTYDDTEVLTALYGYGKATDSVPLNFGSIVWTTAGGDPANKPSGQTYVEDAAATAAYGRNGRARFGYYQNTNISNATTLLQKTWDALQATKDPIVSIDMTVADLHRLGYADEPIRLHDTALVEIQPIGVSLQLEIVRLEIDLLNPTMTRPVIGRYIPNIVYIERETARKSSGRGGGGGRGQTNAEAEISEFETEILANSYQISLRAYQRDMDNVDSILRQAGISLDAQGVITYADDNVNMWQSKLNVQANRIGLVVQGTGANASIKAAEICAAIDAGGSSVHISADKIILNGSTTVDDLFTGNAVATWLRGQQIDGNSINAGSLSASTMTFGAGGESVSWQSQEVVTDESTGSRTTIYYLGRRNA